MTEQLCAACKGTGLANEVTLCAKCDGSGGKAQPADRDVEVTTSAGDARATVTTPMGAI